MKRATQAEKLLIKQEEDQVLADALWWREWGKLFGWRLHGFTYRHEASFYSEDGRALIEITARIRAGFDAALEKASKP